MKNSKLLYVGIKGSVVALDGDTGRQLWVSRLKGDFVNLLLEGDRVYASTYGEIYCLDRSSGAVLWHNPLKGFGTGLAIMATERSDANSSTVVAAEKSFENQQSAAAAAAVSAA